MTQTRCSCTKWVTEASSHFTSLCSAALLRTLTLQPEIVLRTQQDLRRHIRLHSRPTQGLTYKSIREAMPGPELPAFMEELEKDGSVLILRSLTGKLKDAPLPELGRENAWGEKLNAGGPERWKTVFFDTIRENSRATSRVDDGELKSVGYQLTDRVHLCVGGR